MLERSQRLLQALLKEELVLFKSENKTYHAGVGLISFGAVAASSPALAERYMPALFAIANATIDGLGSARAAFAAE